MKKNLFYIFIVSLVSMLFLLTGCKDNTNTNNGGDEDPAIYYTVTFDSRGGSDVESQKVREGNPIVRPETPRKEGYYLTGWLKQDDTEWNFNKDRVTEDMTLYAGWQEETKLPDSTESLTYEKEGNAYTVTGVGEETILVIPAIYEGLPVTKIQGHHGTGAFAQKAITSIAIPNTITEIGQNTFYGCRDLVEVKLENESGLTTIGNNAFSACSSLINITIPKGVTHIGDAAFNNCASLESFIVEAGNTKYRSENGHLIETATQTLIRGVNNSTIPDGIKVIEVGAFRRANGITELNIPKSVEKIGNYFIADSTITKINYAGAESEWEEIEKSSTMWNYGNRNVELICIDEPSIPIEPEQPTDEPKILVVYFSATNTTKTMANYIQSYLNADIFEIIPVVPYTSADLNYGDSNSRTSQENRDDSCRPEIVGRLEDIDQYDVIFIGYPIWHGKAPKVIYTFLEQYDFSGKTIIPFCTAASSGIGSSATYLKNLTPEATWLNGTRFLSTASQSSVQAWIDSVMPNQKEQ
ncbi:MAG: leucine-rich repeat protein [Anaeroplasmataceae bacterium]|nr:leucine-rich repeat protein [Anaeroplasmataceae bacterium]